jgi:hypothetical protein
MTLPMRLLRANAKKHIKITDSFIMPNWDLVAIAFDRSKEELPLYVIIESLGYDYEFPPCHKNNAYPPPFIVDTLTGIVLFTGFPRDIWKWLYTSGRIDWQRDI